MKRLKRGRRQSPGGSRETPGGESRSQSLLLGAPGAANPFLFMYTYVRATGAATPTMDGWFHFEEGANFYSGRPGLAGKECQLKQQSELPQKSKHPGAEVVKVKRNGITSAFLLSSSRY
uniref:Uncharacterized protein n=1 Tax=Panagrellus redivivus TaxID=6233 RepID=A0A7E4VQ03_PANRE